MTIMKITSAAILTTTLLFATSVQAVTLTGQSAINALVGKSHVFSAGSVSNFKSDGSFVFKHSKATDAGTFTINKKGLFKLKNKSGPRKGKTDVFFIDLTDGVYSIHYTRVGQKGKVYSFK